MDNIGMSAFTLKTILLLEVLEYLVSNYLASTCFMFGDVIEANNAEWKLLSWCTEDFTRGHDLETAWTFSRTNTISGGCARKKILFFPVYSMTDGAQWQYPKMTSLSVPSAPLFTTERIWQTLLLGAGGYVVAPTIQRITNGIIPTQWWNTLPTEAVFSLYHECISSQHHLDVRNDDCGNLSEKIWKLRFTSWSMTLSYVYYTLAWLHIQTLSFFIRLFTVLPAQKVRGKVIYTRCLPAQLGSWTFSQEVVGDRANWNHKSQITTESWSS